LGYTPNYQPLMSPVIFSCGLTAAIHVPRKHFSGPAYHSTYLVVAMTTLQIPRTPDWHRGNRRLTTATPLAPALRTPYLRGDGFCSLCDRLYIPEALSNSSAAGSVRTLVRLPGDHLYIQVPRNTEPSVCSGSRHLPYSISRPRHCAPFANIGPALRLG